MFEQLLFVDIETFSSVDLKAAGMYKYVESDDFEIDLLGYAYGHGETRCIDLTRCNKEVWPEHWDPAAQAELESVLAAIQDQKYTKVAHNASFERRSLGKHLKTYLPPEEWVDTMTLALMAGLPGSLEAAGAALGIAEQKLKEGKQLINYFAKPCKPTIANKGRTRNMPWDAPEKWERYKDYNIRDVVAEQQIFYRLLDYYDPAEHQIYCLDARINERGVKVDKNLASAAIAVDAEVTARLEAEMKRLTGLENPNSVSQLKEWLICRGLEVDSLNKDSVKDLLKKTKSPTIRRVIKNRQQLGKTSTVKFQTMLTAACKDDRVRGCTQHYGAGRTGRWSGRLVQLQNLPQNHLEMIEYPRELLARRDLDALEFVYEDVQDTLSQLIRTALIAEEGKTFLVCDYSAIEARVIAYLAQERWRLESFAAGKDIYCASASQMFKVPVEKHGVNGHLRQKGKVAELACGYGGGVNALKAFGADKMGLTEAEMQDIVTQWRAASPRIPQFWRTTENAAKNALRTPGKTFRTMGGVKYRREQDALVCILPSGRKLRYWNARLDEESGKIMFQGQDQTSKAWIWRDVWGGRLVENIVQAYARDCLATAMLRLDRAGYEIVFHVHDEVICEVPEGADWHDMAAIMAKPITWAPGLRLPAEGYETPFYKKD